uniref:AMP-dependent synthetase/ligase n=1 Tax=Acetatifactor sp. TaxID=1872090 RepID=UPI0040559F78
MKTEYPFYEVEYEFTTVKDVVEVVLKTYQDNPVFQYKQGMEVKEKKKEEFVTDVCRLGQLFHEMFPKGSHIALLGKTSYEWLSCYFAIMNSENVTVPLDKELSREDLLELIDFADTDCLVYDKEYQDVADFVRKLSGKERAFICMQENAQEKCLGELLTEYGDAVTWVGNPDKDDIAEIVFTSGTTGKSKGCMLTHGNLAWNAMNGKSFVYLTSKDSALSILPINHALEIAAGIMTPFCSGVTICINDSLKYLARNLVSYKPSAMVVVPLVMETLCKNIWREIEKQNKTKKVRFAMKVAWLLYRCHVDVRRKLFAQILDKLGGNLHLLVVGGAYIEPSLIKDFETWGITVVQGYGITECGPVISCNTDRHRKYDSAGRVVTGCEVKLVEDEIWVKGPIVMKGYYKNAEATQEVFEDGWFKTGDLGRLDKDSFLYITGRKKNLIILPNGENVSPEELEQRILRIPYVKEVVVAEKSGLILAEVFLDKEQEPEAEQMIEADIMVMNKTLPAYKRIAKVTVREREFEKTTTRKIKRRNS